MQSQGLDTELQYKPRMVHVFVVWETVVLCCLTAQILVPHNPCALSSIAHFLPMTTCLQLLWKKEEEEEDDDKKKEEKEEKEEKEKEGGEGGG